MKWHHEFIGTKSSNNRNEINQDTPNSFGWTSKITYIRTNNKVRKLIKKRDTAVIEGIFTCNINTMKKVSVGIHYPSKCLLMHALQTLSFKPTVNEMFRVVDIILGESDELPLTDQVPMLPLIQYPKMKTKILSLHMENIPEHVHVV